MNKTTTLPPAQLLDPRWAKIVARDPSADGSFVYSVRSTGVYCRPSCAARRPNPENVQFHADAAAAELAGFRPCRRCRPDQPPLAERHAALIAAVCDTIRQAETPPPLAELAKQAGLSPFYFNRLFKQMTGLTPKQYAGAVRSQHLRNQLTNAPTVTEAIYAAGYAAPGRFYAESNQILGMTPSRFRAGGRGQLIRFAVGQCSLGAILVAASDCGICAILLGDDADSLMQDLQTRFFAAELQGGDAAFEQTVAQVVGLVEAPQAGLQLPLDLRGTAFQQRVWRALQTIPSGTTVSYRQLAEQIGAPQSARAVAQACAANPLAVAIPCHRVIRIDGGLSGYRWGIARKQALLAREAEQSHVD